MSSKQTDVAHERIAPLRQSVEQLGCIADELERRRYGRTRRAPLVPTHS